MGVTDNLKPKEFFSWFEAITKIPHGSRKEQPLVAFLQEYAAQRNIPCTTDAMGNVFMTVPATPGYEDQPGILFQAHTDMIWQKDPDVEFNFEKDAIRLAITGDKLHAVGTTLGADNGVGVATMLALGDSKTIAHPMLEFLFTVQEEVGLRGARGFDKSVIRSRRMINMDCGDSHVLCVCSAGRVGSMIKKQYPLQELDAGWQLLELAITGGTGGHSGISIQKCRACAANVLGDLLTGLENIPYRLAYFCGNNPIIKQISAKIAVPQEKAEEVSAMLTQRFGQLREIYAQTDPELKMEITPLDEALETLDEKDSADLAAVLSMMRTAPYRLDTEDANRVITSGAICHASLKEGKFALEYNIRSAQDMDRDLLFERYSRALSHYGLEMAVLDKYSGWPEREKSPFRDKFNTIHQKLFGEPMEFERVHGGVEVGVIVGAIPDMDAVGVAPTARGAHTTWEHIYISEAEPYWNLIQAVLAEKE